jgi:type I restriction enzyme S subunit
MAGDWGERCLGELTDNFDSRRVPVNEADRRRGPYPYYGASGVVDHVDGYLFDGEYLLIAEDGENLRTRNTPIAFLVHGKFWVNNHAHIVCGNSEANTRYLMYALQAADIGGYLTGSTMPKLTQGAMNRILVPVPAPHEQRAIAQLLGALDDKIELNRRMNQTLESMARAIFRSWFVDFDPVVAKVEGRQPFGMSGDVAALFPDGFVSDERGEIPFGWHFRPLAEVTTKIGSGATPRGGSAVYVSEGTAFIRSQNVLDHEFEWSGLARITDEAAQELRGVTVREGDVLLNITGDSILRTCLVDSAVLPARVSQHVAIIRPSPGIPPRYLHLRLVDHEMKEFLIGFDAGGTRQAVTKAQLETVPILVPSDTILTRFDQLTEALFHRIDGNRRESRTLAALRDTLLPKLMSGELRVRDAEKLAGAHV